MKVLVVGGGGREHALVWKLANDRCRPELFCAPGNAGTAEYATPVAIAADNLEGLTGWARANRPDLTVIGPEVPLCGGLADLLMAEGFRVFGPTRDAARIEGSKSFAKDVMQAAGVPTAAAEAFFEAAPAKACVRRMGAPVVIKVDGLAAGKGVSVCATEAEADAAIDAALRDRAFGEAGNHILVEACLQGEEASILALVDGERAVLLASAQDHKRAHDGDRGPNTGGMGAYSPAPVVRDVLWPQIRETVFEPVLAELKRRHVVFKGVLYAGLMITGEGIQVLEFNARFGDPETQVILPRLDGDLLPLLEACVDGTLREESVRWKPDHAVTVVMAAAGYPGSYAKGAVIDGLAEAAQIPGVTVFHAGTRLDQGRVLTSGGRVLNVTALGASLREAVDRAYAAADRIRFEGGWCRRDIAFRAV